MNALAARGHRQRSETARTPVVHRGADPSRRTVVRLICGCLGLPASFAGAAAASRKYRVGCLCSSETVPYFWSQLRALGYEEHRNIEYVFKDTDVGVDLPGFAARLATARVDVIVACSNQDAQAALRAAPGVPVVLLYGIVPVEAGLIDSLARPGGNLTGSAAISTDLARKSIEVLWSAVPRLRSLAVIVNLANPVGKILHAATEEAAGSLRIAVTTWDVADAAGLSRAFAGMRKDRPDAISVSVSVDDHIDRIIEFAAAERLPAMYPFAPAVRAGGLMAYSPNWLPQSQRNAQIVDRILKGAHPRDIPVEQPVRYAFSINLKTANAMSLTIPPSVLQQATTIVR